MKSKNLDHNPDWLILLWAIPRHDISAVRFIFRNPIKLWCSSGDTYYWISITLRTPLDLDIPSGIRKAYGQFHFDDPYWDIPF